MGSGLQLSLLTQHLEKEMPLSPFTFIYFFNSLEHPLKHGISPGSLNRQPRKLSGEKFSNIYQNLKIFMLFDPEIALLGIYPITHMFQASPTHGYKGPHSSVTSAEEP